MNKIVYSSGTGEIVEKKSRFIAHVYNITSEEDAQNKIKEICKQYWDARHNCYAYCIGDNNEIQRYNDDKEPQGTAGKPILDVIVNEEIKNCLIIVTRYFGGTLLGTGGLVRAYQGAAKEGLDNCELMEIMDGIIVNVVTDYSNLSKIQYISMTDNISLLEEQYGESVELKYIDKEDIIKAFIEKVTNATLGKASIEYGSKVKFGKIGKNVELID